ncbi:metallophosphoesterase [Corynebacterium aquatimens]|nr:Calcineurin-like phosphoesterase [Corynebacterium aquatimens]
MLDYTASRRTLIKATGVAAGTAGVGVIGASAWAQETEGVATVPEPPLLPADGTSSVGSSQAGWVFGNTGRNSHGSFIAGDLQVITTTEDSAVINWITWDARVSPDLVPQGLPTAGKLVVRAVDNPSEVHVVESPRETFFHQLTVTGLRPSTTYSFVATSHGVEAAATHNIIAESRREFTTQPKMAGPVLATIMVANDTHVGEEADGLLFANFPPPAKAKAGERPYTDITTESVIASAHAVGASHLFVNGDVTSEAKPAEVARAKQLLDGFNGTVRVTRGNHDRPHKLTDGPEYAGAPVYDAERVDPFGAVFEPRQQAWVENILGAGGAVVARVVGIDSTELDSSSGMIEDAQFVQIERIFNEDRTTPTVVMLHHPCTRAAAWSNAGGPGFVLRDKDIVRLQELIAKQTNIKLVLSGHTHRARKNAPDAAKNTVFLETPAAKNWPTGATQIRFFKDGMAITFRQNTSEEALRWAARTRWTIFGLSPSVMLGPIEARALTIFY